MFRPGNFYSKNDIYELLEVPEERRRGAWDKGIRKYNDVFFIFANVGIPGRTGHNYDNFWDGDLFHWQAANESNIIQPQVKELIGGIFPILIFTRSTDRGPFVYEGRATVLRHEDTVPVRIVWQFIDEAEYNPNRLPEEVIGNQNLWEGATTSITVNRYERNPEARRQCIVHYGVSCQACDLNFEERYGEIGVNFIHVHHTRPLAQINETYIVDPIADLIPVCPNCHSMLHKTRPVMTVTELRTLLGQRAIIQS